MLSHKWKALSMAGLCLVLMLSGCKHERDDDGQAFYNDVGETDLDRRVYSKTPRTTRAELPGVDAHVETANKRHSYEVGEMSLDSGVPTSRSPKKSAPKTNQQSQADALARDVAARKAAVIAAAARSAELALRAPRQKAELTKPVPLAKPAAQAPARSAPAPAAAPEYRTRETASQPKRYNHGTNVGEQMLGY